MHEIFTTNLVDADTTDGQAAELATCCRVFLERAVVCPFSSWKLVDYSIEIVMRGLRWLGGSGASLHAEVVPRVSG